MPAFPDTEEQTTPVRSLAGPSRTRTDSRHARSSMHRPYARQSYGGTGLGAASTTASSEKRSTTSPAQERRPSASLARRGSTTSDKEHGVPTTPGGSSAGGLFSGLRQAIFSRPLSWLQRGGPQSEKVSSANTPRSQLSKEHQSAAQRLYDSTKPNSVTETTAARSSSSFVAPQPSTPSRSSLTATPAYPSRESYHLSLSGRSGRRAGANDSLLGTPRDTSLQSGAARSPSPAHSSSASALIRSHGRQRLSMEPSSPRLAGSTLGTPNYRHPAIRRSGGGGDDSVSGISQAQSSASFAYGYGSERRLGGLGSSSVSMHGDLAASSSYGRIPSRSPFAMQRRSLGAGLSGLASASEAGSNGFRASPRSAYGAGGMGSITTPSRPVSMFGGQAYGGSGSRAGSAMGSQTSSRTNTPKRREWSSLRIQPPSGRRSEGEELMREYVSMRNAGQLSDTSFASPFAVDHVSGSAHVPLSSSSATGDPSSSFNQSGSLKRGASMSIDGDAIMSDANYEHPRKRQMVWDPELGFVSRQEQRAHLPPRPVANNEAERLLNALEGMRTPLRDARLDGKIRSNTPSRDTLNVHVPIPVAASSSEVRQHGGGDYVKAVSPYSRALRRSKLSQSVEPEAEGMRSRLRRQTGQARASVARSRQEDDMSVGTSHEEGEGDRSDEGSEDDEKHEQHLMDDDGVDDDDQIVEPPRKKTGLALRSRPQEERAAESKGSKSSAAVVEARTLRSGKVLQPSIASPSKGEQDTPRGGTTSKPMSKARVGISVNGASAANKQRAERQQLFGPSSQASASTPAKAPGFSVRIDSPTGSTDTQVRNRSSLRHGAEKTSRTHARSGRIGLDEEMEDESSADDSPSTDELDKIKLPTNLFPQGFSFSGSNGSTQSSSLAGSPSAIASPKLPALPAPGDDKGNDGESASKSSETDGGPSLLSRLGGFAPQTEVKESSSAQQQSSSTGETKAIPSFSFGSASSSSSTAPSFGAPSQSSSSAGKPLFAFQPSVSSPLAGGASSSTTEQAPAKNVSSFFTPPDPSEKKSASPLADESTARKEGPVPNFFASSLASSAPAPTPPKPAFSFDAPTKSASFAANEASKPSLDSTSTQSKPPSFSFSSPASSSTQSTPVFSLAPSAPKTTTDTASSKDTGTTSSLFSGFGQSNQAVKPEAASQTPSFGGFGSSQAPASPFSFGSASETKSSNQAKDTSATSAPSFGGFGSSTTQKRTADEGDGKEEGPQKKAFGGFGSTSNAGTTGSAPTFSFGNTAAPSPAVPSAAPSSTGFSFSTTPAQSTTNSAAKPSFSFGSANAAAGTDTPNSSSNGFASGMNNGSSANNSSMATKPSFAFGNNQSQANNATSTPSTAAFTFGNSPKPPTMGATGASQPTSGFAFGSTPFGSSSAPNSQPGSANPFGSQDNSRQASPAAPFSIGGQSSSGGMGGGGGGFSMQPSSSGSPAPFTFGAPPSGPSQPPSGGQATQTGNQSGFSFSVPMSGTGAGAVASNPFGASQTGSATGSPQPFVFGSSTNGAQSPGPGGFTGFGQAPMGGSSGGGMAATGTPPPAQQSNSLFNIGGPSSSPAGNRPVRGMPSRRRRA